MQQGIATIVIEPRSLVRGALVSLMANHSYQVVGSFASTTDVENTLLAAEAPRLVILVGQRFRPAMRMELDRLGHFQVFPASGLPPRCGNSCMTPPMQKR